MAKEFYEYTFDSETTEISSYDQTKINLGPLIKRAQDANGKNYVSPLESKFFRVYESYADYSNAMAAIEYSSTKIWVFHTFWGSASLTKNFYLHEYDKSADTFTYIGRLTVTGASAANLPYQISATLDNHTSGTVSVSGTNVSGVSTSWKTDGACVGNRIGFGSTDPTQITTWYQIGSITDDSNLVLTSSAGTIAAGTQYVIEDLRIVYVNYNNGTTPGSGVFLVKGLRFELFSQTITNTIPFATTVDNIRATYRLANAASSSYLHYGGVPVSKISFTEQYFYTTTGTGTTISIQKYNIRAALTLSSGLSTNAFVLSTGSQAHGGSAIQGLTSVCTAIYSGTENLFVAPNNRIIRINPVGVTSGSTTFITDSMVESPPGGTSNYALTSTLRGIAWLKNIDRFIVFGNYNGASNKTYLTQYSPGGIFERYFMALDTLQNSTYASFYTNELNCPISGSTTVFLDGAYAGGITFVSKYIASSSNSILFSFTLDADEEYEPTTNSCIITPEISTSSATALTRIWVNSKGTFNSGFVLYPREYYKIYYRTSGIAGNSGAWTIIPDSGDLSGVTPTSSIQFKIVFRTIGTQMIADKIYGLTITYDTSADPASTSFYEPSISNSNPGSGIIAWRQREVFSGTNIPNLTIKIYDSSNVLLLTDTTNSPTLGTWQYSTNGGNTWNTWTSSANVIGNYIRYTPTSPVGVGQKVKIILFET
jgi:hypothetical protein